MYLIVFSCVMRGHGFSVYVFVVSVLYIMFVQERNNGLRLCKCKSCCGKWIPTSSFYRHAEDDIARKQRALCPKFSFDEDAYRDPKLQSPLFEGSETTILEAVTEHLYVFAVNHGMSKGAVSDVLQSHKATLPKPNQLPGSFQEAKRMIKHLLIPLSKYEVCINDCVIFRDKHLDLDQCPSCGEPRRLNGCVRKSFTYMPIGPRLARWFGTSNLCQLLYADKISINGTLTDFTDGDLYESWFREGGVFENMKEEHCVPLSLFADGVNPNKHQSAQKSMWPVMLTWINLPRNIRQVLGPMLLVGIIPSGLKGCEPKTLEPYFELLTEELLELTEFPVWMSYIGAPVKVKVALLQFLCDIPAFSKVLHLSGQAALRSCPYCQENGYYCHHLKKTIHLSNRSFLPLDDSLRNSEGFGLKERDTNIPVAYSRDEEIQKRKEYDTLPNKTQKLKHQKQTGLKGTYNFMKLPYHDRASQMQPDGMHTIADFINHLMDMLTGKHDSSSVRNCEKKFNRFPEIWIPEDYSASTMAASQSTKGKKSLKRKRIGENVNPLDIGHFALPRTPWSLSKEEIKTADERASTIRYSTMHEVTPGPHFSKPWTLRTMCSKLQFVTSGALEWCIKGFLPTQQEETLRKVLDVIRRLVTPTLSQQDLPFLQKDAHTALVLFERDFPLSMQNLVTHLLHHLVDGFSTNGPLYGRWLFAYERANGWISRQCLKKGFEESTVMETYAVYDWCMYMVLSKKYVPSASTVKNRLASICDDFGPLYKFDAESGTKVTLTSEMKTHMKTFYELVLKFNIFHFEEKVKEKVRFHSDEKKLFSQSAATSKNGSLVKLFCPSDSNLFGNIRSLFEHNVNLTLQTWAVVDVYPRAEKRDGSIDVPDTVIGQRLIHVDLICDPAVYVKKNETIHVLNSC